MAGAFRDTGTTLACTQGKGGGRAAGARRYPRRRFLGRSMARPSLGLLSFWSIRTGSSPTYPSTYNPKEKRARGPEGGRHEDFRCPRPVTSKRPPGASRYDRPSAAETQSCPLSVIRAVKSIRAWAPNPALTCPCRHSREAAHRPVTSVGARDAGPAPCVHTGWFDRHGPRGNDARELRPKCDDCRFPGASRSATKGGWAGFSTGLHRLLSG